MQSKCLCSSKDPDTRCSFPIESLLYTSNEVLRTELTYQVFDLNFPHNDNLDYIDNCDIIVNRASLVILQLGLPILVSSMNLFAV